MKLPDTVYDVLKWLCMVVSPAVCTLIAILSKAWEWDIPTEAIITTITAVTAFIGAIIGISTAEYNRNK